MPIKFNMLNEQKIRGSIQVPRPRSLEKTNPAPDNP